MKKNFLLITILVYCVIYTTTSLALWEFNPGKWFPEARYFVAVMSPVIALGSCFIYHNETK